MDTQAKGKADEENYWKPDRLSYYHISYSPWTT